MSASEEVPLGKSVHKTGENRVYLPLRTVQKPDAARQTGKSDPQGTAQNSQKERS